MSGNSDQPIWTGMSKYRIAAATLATVAGFSLLGPTSVSAAKNDGPGNGRANGGEQVVEATEVALHNDRASSGTDCPDNGAWWHFVLAPNSGAHTIDAMHLMVSGSAFTINAAEIVLNHGQTDNVFVAVPDGHSVEGLSSAGSSATVTGPAGRVRFVLSHVCGQNTQDVDDGSDNETINDEIVNDETVNDEIVNDDIVNDEIVTDDIVNDEIVTEESMTGSDDEIVTEKIKTDEIITEENDDNPAHVEIDHDPEGYPTSESNDIAADAVPSVEADVPVLTAQVIELVVEDAPEAVTPVERLHINLDNKRTITTVNDTIAATTSITETVEASHTTTLPKTGLGLGLGGLAIMLIGLGEAIRRGTLRKVA
jgi:hypothetical protein